MESIGIVSFLTFFLLSMLGAYFHYRKVSASGRHVGSLYSYLITHYPGRTGAVWIALLGSAWTSATSGIADNINPQLVWNLLMDGQLHIASINIAVLAVTSGYAFDSALNKGSKE